MVQLVQTHAAHRVDDRADDNVCQWGSRAIRWLANNHEPSKTKVIAAGAEAVLKSIRADASTYK